MLSTELPQPDSTELAHSEQLQQLIREEITQHGPMPFSRFMERCLYAPGLGYYSAGRHKFGQQGDFVTAPELGEIFGRCLAHALTPTLQALGTEADLMELGGGSGALAATLLLSLEATRALPRRYLMLEPSADLKQRQQQYLHDKLPEPLFQRLTWIDRPPPEAWQGVMVANEVIDALPTTRFTLRDGEVLEEHICANDAGHFMRQDRPADALVSAAARHLADDLGYSFANGYRSEMLPQLPYWLQAVADRLERGVLWFIDYGYTRREFYHPERRNGTLMVHYRHRAHDDVLLWPGLQDITASVDFTALAEAGNQAGFLVASYLNQAQFLMASNMQQIHADLIAGSDAATTYAIGQQIKRLMLPGQMGERFKVMALARNLEAVALPDQVLAASQGGRL